MISYIFFWIKDHAQLPLFSAATIYVILHMARETSISLTMSLF